MPRLFSRSIAPLYSISIASGPVATGRPAVSPTKSSFGVRTRATCPSSVARAIASPVAFSHTTGTGRFTSAAIEIRPSNVGRDGTMVRSSA
jgi:hypothetical protein